MTLEKNKLADKEHIIYDWIFTNPTKALRMVSQRHLLAIWHATNPLAGVYWTPYQPFSSKRQPPREKYRRRCGKENLRCYLILSFFITCVYIYLASRALYPFSVFLAINSIYRLLAFLFCLPSSKWSPFSLDLLPLELAHCIPSYDYCSLSRISDSEYDVDLVPFREHLHKFKMCFLPCFITAGFQFSDNSMPHWKIKFY